jgi:hypothetical protein
MKYLLIFKNYLKDYFKILLNFLWQVDFITNKEHFKIITFIKTNFNYFIKDSTASAINKNS